VADEAERTLEGGRWKVDFLKQPLSYDWMECCVQQFLATLANAVASLACFGSCLVPFGAWAGQHYKFQADACEQWKVRLRQLVEGGQRDAAQSALDGWYPYALDVFGADGSANEDRYCELGIKRAQNAHVRQIFADVARISLGQVGLQIANPYQGARARYEPGRG
jgi:1,2-phenylacetyl-CoA epoxidase catalytic subunit